MIVTIWRHGEAGRAATDRQRELTTQGQDDVSFGCRQFLKALQARELAFPELILHSPFNRTVQTAAIISSAFTQSLSQECPRLQPDQSVSPIDKCLAAIDDATEPPAHVILVSHQPLVSQLVEFYLGESADVPPLSPGALVTYALDVPAQNCGELIFWAAPPEYEAGL